MRILVIVRCDFRENRKCRKEQGFLGNIRYPRVSRRLSCALTERDDGQRVNIPALVGFFACNASG